MNLARHNTSFSFEVFPPNKQTATENLYDALLQMKGLNPDYISVTCSNLSKNINDMTVKVARYVKEQLELPCVAHLPAAYFSKAQITDVLKELEAIKVDGLLALRGDFIEGIPPVGDFQYASDLISYIKETHTHLPIFGACYPEIHPDSKSRVEDIRHLKLKADAGCEKFITQLFFDNDIFYDFKEHCEIAGIHAPIVAGIMPIVNRNQALRLIKTTKAHLPKKFLAILEKYEHNPQALKDAGLAYAIDQITDLVAQDAAGVHLYTMNRADVAKYIYYATVSLFRA